MRSLALPLVLLLAGCPIGNNKQPKPADLSPGWRVDKLRVLALESSPPEVAPGQQVNLSSLTVDPDDTLQGIVYIACPTDDSGTGFGCQLPDDLDFENLDPADLVDAGVIGFEPGFPPVLDVPSDYLDGLPPEEAERGRYYLVQAIGIPKDAAVDPDNIDFGTFIASFKRVVVSSKTAPNNNPGIAHFTIDGEPVPAGATVVVDPGQRYQIGVALAPDAIEDYIYVNDEGVAEERTEEPYFRYFTTAGTQVADTTLYPYTDAPWDADLESGEEGTWWVIVRDRRGGLQWVEQPFRVR